MNFHYEILEWFSPLAFADSRQFSFLQEFVHGALYCSSWDLGALDECLQVDCFRFSLRNDGKN